MQPLITLENLCCIIIALPIDFRMRPSSSSSATSEFFFLQPRCFSAHCIHSQSTMRLYIYMYVSYFMYLCICIPNSYTYVYYVYTVLAHSHAHIWHTYIHYIYYCVLMHYLSIYICTIYSSTESDAHVPLAHTAGSRGASRCSMWYYVIYQYTHILYVHTALHGFKGIGDGPCNVDPAIYIYSTSVFYTRTRVTWGFLKNTSWWTIIDVSIKYIILRSLIPIL